MVPVMDCRIIVSGTYRQTSSEVILENSPMMKCCAVYENQMLEFS